MVACFCFGFSIGRIAAGGERAAETVLNPCLRRLGIHAEKCLAHRRRGHTHAQRRQRRDQARKAAFAMLTFHLFEATEQRFDDLRR